jgi:uncharacterized MAPEG superfamily protein
MKKLLKLLAACLVVSFGAISMYLYLLQWPSWSSLIWFVPAVLTLVTPALDRWKQILKVDE